MRKLGEKKQLKSLFCIKVEGPESLKFAETFCSKEVTLWGSAKEQHINQGKRKYKKLATNAK